MPIGQPTFKGRAVISGASNVKITNLSLPVANTEVSLALQSDLKVLEIKDRTNAKLQFSYVSSQSGTNYVTIPKGCNYDRDGIDFSGETLYIQADKITTVEIIEYY